MSVNKCSPKLTSAAVFKKEEESRIKEQMNS